MVKIAQQPNYVILQSKHGNLLLDFAAFLELTHAMFDCGFMPVEGIA